MAREGNRCQCKAYPTHLWIILALVVALSLGLLLYFGREIYQLGPACARERVEASSGELVFTGDRIHQGQDVWCSIGGQELGSVWGHSSYTAPDWTADWTSSGVHLAPG